jgi:hypothetical protein
MKKKSFLVLICFMSLMFFGSTLHGQGTKRTITLPSGDVVCDLNGEWDSFAEHYGEWSQNGSAPNVFNITQRGSSFVAIRMKGALGGLFPPGSKAVSGELDKSGFKKVQIMTMEGPLDSKGQISDDGNKIVIDEGLKIKITLTRK